MSTSLDTACPLVLGSWLLSRTNCGVPRYSLARWGVRLIWRSTGPLQPSCRLTKIKGVLYSSVSNIHFQFFHWNKGRSLTSSSFIAIEPIQSSLRPSEKNTCLHVQGLGFDKSDFPQRSFRGHLTISNTLRRPILLYNYKILTDISCYKKKSIRWFIRGMHELVF